MPTFLSIFKIPYVKPQIFSMYSEMIIHIVESNMQSSPNIHVLNIDVVKPYNYEHNKFSTT
jgi:hypothetical protein